MNQIKYKIIQSSNPDHLARDVVSLLEEGYELVGSLVVFTSSYSTYYVRELVKYPPKEL